MTRLENLALIGNCRFAELVERTGSVAPRLPWRDLEPLPAQDPRMYGAIDAIQVALSLDGWLRRYGLDDGFCKSTVAFLQCSFWRVEALVATGRDGEARAEMVQVEAALPRLGLVAEDNQPVEKRKWGYRPQAHSHVELIRTSFAPSPRWSDVL